MRSLLNVIGFQMVWNAAVGGAAQGWWWAGPLALAVFFALHMVFHRNWQDDARLMAIAAAMGLVVDSAWVQAGWMVFDTAVPWPSLAPVWIVAMWMGFALTLNHSLAFLKGRPWLGAWLGLLGGPLAYWAAERGWAAVQIQPTFHPYLALGLAWAMLTPALAALAARMKEQTVTGAAS